MSPRNLLAGSNKPRPGGALSRASWREAIRPTGDSGIPSDFRVSEEGANPTKYQNGASKQSAWLTPFRDTLLMVASRANNQGLCSDRTNCVRPQPNGLIRIGRIDAPDLATCRIDYGLGQLAKVSAKCLTVQNATLVLQAAPFSGQGPRRTAPAGTRYRFG
jgi:hypothetical protein